MSARLVRVTLALGLVAGSPGCVYYNGMYNANKNAREAQRFEREGRAAEARDRWQRAVIHAESVATRHPRSRWADDALLLRGRGLVRLEIYAEAAVVLEQAVRVAGSQAVRAEALMWLGRANTALGRYDIARAVLDSALASRHAAVTDEAMLLRGRALRALGALEAAIGDFTASGHPFAPYDRASALLARRDTAEARAQLEALADARPYRETAWRGALDTLARLGSSASAAHLVDRLAARGDMTRGERARLLLDDGDRRGAAGDTGAARARYDAAAGLAADSVEARLAEVRLARLAIAHAGTEADLAAAGRRLEALAQEGGAPAREAQPALRILGRLEDLSEDAEAPDARWFVRGELLRDSLRSLRLAAWVFGEMAARYPVSPWTPKALVAAIAAGHPAVESLRTVLDGRYADSPYRLAALGLASSAAEADAYRVLEDSLSELLGGMPPSQRRDEPARREGEREDDRPPPARPVAPQARPQPARPAIPPRSPSDPPPLVVEPPQ